MNERTLDGLTPDHPLRRRLLELGFVRGAPVTVVRRAPLGFGDWQATGALIPGFVAKEVEVGTLGQIYLGEIAANPEPLAWLKA